MPFRKVTALSSRLRATRESIETTRSAARTDLKRLGLLWLATDGVRYYLSSRNSIIAHSEFVS